MHGGRLKYLVISLAPLLLLSGLVYYRTRNEFSILDSPRGEKKAAGYFLQTSTKSIPVEETYSSSLQIKGDEYFKENAKQALKLIWLSDRESFYFIKKYVFEIRQESKTGFYFDEGVPVVAISQANAQKSLTWLAGVIAHNAWHAYREFSTRAAKRKKKEVPLPGENKKDYSIPSQIFYEGKSFDEFLEAEKEACAYQEETLAKIGASKSEIFKVKNREEKDFYIGHDGEYFVNN